MGHLLMPWKWQLTPWQLVAFAIAAFLLFFWMGREQKQ